MLDNHIMPAGELPTKALDNKNPKGLHIYSVSLASQAVAIVA